MWLTDICGTRRSPAQRHKGRLYKSHREVDAEYYGEMYAFTEPAKRVKNIADVDYKDIVLPVSGNFGTSSAAGRT
ncbi:hypothetical protein JK361_26060 [Streptomyces sp. 5-8]|uniref:Uncharacterized protein n=1 Tax=Streptomyces musisoli TaxID=2802280 RepID=A0ABS1P7W9_9ACTN|nr:hypothetical protein [Streptomyces musisoli]MBL1108011.1 hypothetical protein [Streptomyces musisoli]